MFQNIFNQNQRLLIIIFVSFFSPNIFLNCSSSPLKIEKKIQITKSGDTDKLIRIINEINANSPESISADFNIEGKIDSRNFKSLGNIQINNKPRKVNIKFHDAIFGSALTIIAQDEEIIKIYFPIEKMLYLDNSDKIMLANYSSIDFDFPLVSDIIAGKIPVIKEYTVMEALEESGSGLKQGAEAYRYIILENKRYYETVSFKNDIPDKILWLNKENKEKVEVYFKNIVRNEKILFYKNIKLVSQKSDSKIEIYFKNINFNIPLDFKKVTTIKIAEDCKIVKMN